MDADSSRLIGLKVHFRGKLIDAITGLAMDKNLFVLTGKDLLKLF